jgi:phosphatidate cytidylyltransferase
MHFDKELIWLLGGVLGLLTIASLIGWTLAHRPGQTAASAVISNLNDRIRAWWVMVSVFALAMATGKLGALLLFGLTSFLALREFVTLTPTKRGDHRSLFWSFFILLPLQYVLVGTGWYGMFVILIPVYGFLLIPTRNAISGDCERFLERTAKIHWGLMVCVYCVSHAPALLSLDIPGYSGNGKLLFFFVLIAQLNDVMQYVFGKLFGRHKVAPAVSPHKTWEGLIGGVTSVTFLGAGLWWATPFTPWMAGVASFMVAAMGFFGGLTMSAIKRDRGVKDFGSSIPGHGGVLDRIDSICFAAPVFFHLVRYTCT